MEVRSFELPSAAVGELVQSGEVDLSAIQTNRWDFGVETIMTAPLTLARPALHPFAGKRSIGCAELRSTPLIWVGTKMAIRLIIDDVLGTGSLSLNWQYEAQHVETAVNFVEAGLGFAVAPSVDVALHRGRILAAVPLRSPSVSCTHGPFMRRRMPLSPPAATLREHLLADLNAKFF